MLDNLIEQEGMNEAQELLYSGCSAGGLTTFLHADYVRDVISQRAPTARVVALIDAMYSRDIIVNSLGEEPRLNSMMEWGFTAWGSALSRSHESETWRHRRMALYVWCERCTVCPDPDIYTQQ